MLPLDHSIYISPFTPVVSLDAILASAGPDRQSALEIPAQDESAEDRLDELAFVNAMNRFLRSLPPHDRDLIHRHFWDNEPQAAIARMRGVSAAAISKRMSKILTRAKRALVRYAGSYT
jgi:RNA polymerase sigma factor (sigma-70 family)